MCLSRPIHRSAVLGSRFPWPPGIIDTPSSLRGTRQRCLSAVDRPRPVPGRLLGDPGPVLGTESLQAAFEGASLGVEAERREAADDAREPAVVVIGRAPPPRPTGGKVRCGLDRDLTTTYSRVGKASQSVEREHHVERAVESVAKGGRVAKLPDRLLCQGWSARHESASVSQGEQPL